MPNMAGHRSTFPGAAWEIVEEEFRPEENRRRESLFALGNGYLGTRGTFEEGLAASPGLSIEGTYLNGFFESSPIEYGEKAYGYAAFTQTMLNLPNGKAIRLYLEDEAFSLLEGKILGYRRALDLRRGLLNRSVVWESPQGRQVQIEYQRLASFSDKHILALCCTVTPLNFGGRIRLVSALDAEVANLAADEDPRAGSGFDDRGFRLEETALEGVTGAMRLRTERSGLILACAMTHEIRTGGRVSLDTAAREDRLETRFDVTGEKGCPISLHKYVAYIAAPECEEERLIPTAIALADRARAGGFDRLQSEQESFLRAFWRRAGIELEGDPGALLGLRFNMFHLLQAAGRDGHTSISAKGLSGQGYAGHYFWEAEVYVLPFFRHSLPEVAAKLLEYRHRTLDKARERARQMSHPRGALFPWRTIDGEECSACYQASTAQYHIDADIALAVRGYVESTGDDDFLADYGAEIVFETARLWADLGTFSAKKGGRFCLNDVTGPDEYTAIVDNNYYTNLMARENLLYACQTADWLRANRRRRYDELAARLDLTDDEIGFWRRAAEGMYLPYDEELRIHPQDDTFLAKEAWGFAQTPADRYPLLLHYHPLVIYRHQVCKQADVVLALFLQGDKFTLEEKRRDYDYYEPLTTHDSSLSPSIFSIVASEIGYRDKAYDYFLRSARMDLDDLYGNTDSGIHAANMAGSWMAVVNGFGGMRVYDGTLHFQPYLPDGWREYSFRVTFRGRLIKVTVDAEKVVYELLEGAPLAIRHQGAEVRLGGESPVLTVRDAPPDVREEARAIEEGRP